MATLDTKLVVACPMGATAGEAKLRQVLELVEQGASAWPSLDVWEQRLPAWFREACAPPLSNDQAIAWMTKWRAMSEQEKMKAEQERSWSLADWLYWMDPANSSWQWIGIRSLNETQLEVVLKVDSWPVALGALYWLCRAAGVSMTGIPNRSGEPYCF